MGEGAGHQATGFVFVMGKLAGFTQLGVVGSPEKVHTRGTPAQVDSKVTRSLHLGTHECASRARVEPICVRVVWTACRAATCPCFHLQGTTAATYRRLSSPDTWPTLSDSLWVRSRRFTAEPKADTWSGKDVRKAA